MKLVLFNIDGTLTNTVKVDSVCYKKAFLKTFDIDLSNQDWNTVKDATDSGIMEEIFLKERKRVPKNEEYRKMQMNFLSELNMALTLDATAFKEIEGATSFVNNLINQPNLRIGLATGGWSQSALLKLSAISIFTDGHCFSHSDRYKSKIEILSDSIAQAKELYQLNFSKVIYFGDSMYDLVCSKTLGIEFLGIDYDKNNTLTNQGAKLVFHDYTDKLRIEELLNTYH